jgi:hypothetical protein
MTKAVLLLGPDGVAIEPAMLCADIPEEAQQGSLPLLDDAIAYLSGGKEIRANGAAGYELYERGQPVASLEIFEAPAAGGQPGSER